MVRKNITASLCTAIVFLLAAANPAFGLRCGNELVGVGDYKFEVLDKCDEPHSKEIVGYTINKYQKREYIIEHWVYGPWSGYYYVMVFVGGRVAEINQVKK